MNNHDLTLKRIADTNLDRCLVWHPSGLQEWSSLEWAGAMCGEAGEAANVAKKLKRVDTGLKGSDRTPREELLAKYKKEIGDVFLYLDLMAQREGLTLEECVVYAFNQTSEKEGFPQRL